MRILDIREQTVPINSPMANAFISFAKMDVSVVAIITDEIRDGRPVVGYGFNSNGRYAQGGLLRERIFPRLLEAQADALVDESGILDPGRIWDVAMRDEKPGGHGERAVALGIVDMAAWDLRSKLQGEPLHRLLAREETGIEPHDKVWVYAAGGYYYPGGGTASLVEEMRGYLDLGYRTVKLKIGGASLDEDRQRIEAVLGLLPEGATLAVDANGRFDVLRAVEYADALSGYSLEWYEEPNDPLDFAGLATIVDAYPGALATGENLLSRQDARNLLLYGGLRPERDFLQMDPALSYGLTEYLRTLDLMREVGWSPSRCVPHGGHQFNLAIAAAFHLGGCESYPGIFEPFGGFADNGSVEDGYVRIPDDAPGIGLELKAGLLPILQKLAA
ncbi:MAG: enolase C-terminal domain-like protein [Dehalococcoidia bacterium]